MANVVWIASYPKSGNTWLRFLIAHLAGGPMAESGELQNRIPDAHRIRDWSALPAGQTLLMKTHWLPGRLPRGLSSAGMIYVVRNPFDVIASNFRFSLLGSDESVLAQPAAEIARLRTAYVAAFLHHAGDPHWIKHGFGSYREHIQAWRGHAEGRPSLFLRYEDLHREPHELVRRIAAFLNLSADDARVDDAVRASSFAALRQLEDREIAAQRKGLFFGHPGRRAGHDAGKRFVAKGAAAFGRDEFDPDQWERIRAVFAQEIEACGYRPAVDALAPATVAEPLSA